jgi:hypothetical protein
VLDVVEFKHGATDGESLRFSDPKVVVMVIVVAIVGLIILMPLSRALANH